MRALLPVTLTLLLIFSVPAMAAPRILLTHLPNGGFERGQGDQVADWKPYEQGYTVDLAVHHGGRRSLRCHSDTAADAQGAVCSQTLNQTAPAPVLVSGWSRAEGVGGSADDDYSLYVDLTYTDGTSLWGQTADFETGTHDWQRRHVLIVPTKPLRNMNVYALFRRHAGTVWFDDFDARELAGDRLFDSQALDPPSLPASFRAGWLARDVAAGSSLRPLSALGLRLERRQVRQGGAVVQAAVRNTTPHTRAVTVYYVERFAAPQAVWWDDIRAARPARGGGEYANLTRVSVGATGQMSLYPFGCVTGRGGGRALGIPPGLGPRVARIAFHPRTGLLFVAFDLALSGRGDPTGHDRAAVAVVRYDIDPQWGFRDAAARFYTLFPDAFRRRVRADGLWIPFTDPGTVAGLGDFHVAYHEGDNSVAGDRRRGILSFRYVEPMTYWMPMAPSVPRIYEAALALARRLAAGTDETARRQAQAVLTSGSRDAQGRFNVQFRDTPWANGAVWVLNPNPRLPCPAGGWTKAALNTRGEPEAGEANPPDGEFLDSLEGWADVLDYGPGSLRWAGTPPTFTPDSPRPALPTWFSVYEDAAFLSRDLHHQGKLLMANSTPWRFSVFAPLLDVLGTETDWFPGGTWRPDSDAVFNLRRTVCYHKPYLLLLNTDFTKIDSAQVERYFRRCLFYGVFPSMFSADAATHPYWEEPHWYDRDRPLFQKYLPVIQRLSAAGWEPVTWARSNRPSVWLERYGTHYLTALNSGDVPAEAQIRIDAARLWPGVARPRLVIRDALTGENIPVNGTIVRLTLQAGETRVLALSTVRLKTADRPRGNAMPLDTARAVVYNTVGSKIRTTGRGAAW